MTGRPLQNWFFIFLITLPAFLFSQQVKFDDWKNLTTSGELPAEVKTQNSNNNLDLVRFHGKYYLAFRTAPTHFASRKALIYILSSRNLESWDYEYTIQLNSDVREPRFIVYHDTLNLYFFRGGTRMFRFEPKEMLICQKSISSSWSPPKSVGLDGFVPWRVRERNDTLYLSAYYGRNLYRNNHHSDLRLFQSTDALRWQPISTDPQVNILSAEEGEFIFDKAGNLFATVRLEGTGALICKADKLGISNWQTRRTKTKYDSALLFSHDDNIYLVGRRNLDGEIDKVRNRKSEKQGRLRNLIRYSLTRKVTSLFKFDKDSLQLSLVATFPSTGDNAYAAIAPISENEFVLMNYSSDIKGRKKNWLSGQLGKTYIFWTKLRFGY